MMIRSQRLFYSKIICPKQYNFSCLSSLHNFSTNSTSATTPHYLKDPSFYIPGITQDDIKNNKELANYFAANFADFQDPYEAQEQILQHLQEQESKADVMEQDDKHPFLHLNIRSITTTVREKQGSRACQQLRADDWIPGAISGPSSKTEPKPVIHVKTKWNDFQRELDKFPNKLTSRIYHLTLQNSEQETISQELVLPIDLRMHPIKNFIINCNFLRYFPGRAVPIPVRYINQDDSPLLRRVDTLVLQLKRFVPCVIEEGVPIPDYLNIDCTGIKKKGVLTLSRAILPDGVQYDPKKVKLPERLAVGTIWGGKTIKADDEEDT